jgi:hypothetical protein
MEFLFKYNSTFALKPSSFVINRMRTLLVSFFSLVYMWHLKKSILSFLQIIIYFIEKTGSTNLTFIVLTKCFFPNVPTAYTLDIIRLLVITVCT